jgi:hypothetical protein
MGEHVYKHSLIKIHNNVKKTYLTHCTILRLIYVVITVSYYKVSMKFKTIKNLHQLHEVHCHSRQPAKKIQ